MSSNRKSPLEPAPESCVRFSSPSGGLAEGSLVRLEHGRLVFELVWPEGVLHKSETLSSLQVFLDGEVVSRGEAVVSNVIQTPNKLTVEAVLREPPDHAFLHQRSGDVASSVERVSRAMALAAQAPRLPVQFRLAVADLCHLLGFLQLRLDAEEARGSLNRGAEYSDTRSLLLEAILEAVSPALSSAFARLEDAQRGIEEADWGLASAHLKRALHPLTLCAPFMHRTFTKPLGYAGDYEMVNMMVSPPFQGGSLYAKVLNAFFLNTPPVVAHRGRLHYLLEAIEQEALRVHREGRSLHIYSLGCGPAWEIEAFVARSELSRSAAFTLVDFNQETLNFATQRVAQVSRLNYRSAQATGIKRSVAQLLKASAGQGRQREAPVYDLVYCAGLFDYLPDAVCVELLGYLHALLRPAGRLIATNVESANPSRGWMEAAVDWYLFHRSPAEFAQFWKPSGCDEEVRLFAESSGVNLLLDIRNN